MANIKDLLARNEAWAEKVKKQNPSLFEELAQGQEPDYLWIGCADSRVPSNMIVDVQPGELFVHRNIANMVTNLDLSSMSVIPVGSNKTIVGLIKII